MGARRPGAGRKALAPRRPRTVQGMVRLADDHGEPRLDALCAEALDLNRLASGFLRERLKNGGDAALSRPEADENRRDSSAFETP